MSNNKNKREVSDLIDQYSAEFDFSKKETAIILAAGHGKRIKSKTSKMLHNIWGIPTVERVYNACKRGLTDANIIIVVGIKAADIIRVIGKRDYASFAYQEEQNGTGHAVQIALNKFDMKEYEGVIYVLPGDMGLINEYTMNKFKSEFTNSGCNMMVLTGLYKGDPVENSYGRIIRVNERDVDGNPSGNDFGKVIEIIEHKDIINLPDDKPYLVKYNSRNYKFTKDELIRNNEFNSGVYAFDYKMLSELISNLKSNNVQKEIYITDLINLFNKNNYTVGAVITDDQDVVMGFNIKSVLKQMEAIARRKAYNQLKDIVEIDDPEDFFMDEEVIEKIIEADKRGEPLELKIGKGVHIGKGVELNYNLTLKKNVYVKGNVKFGKNAKVWENVHLSCFPNQEFIIGNNVEIFWGNIIKGNIKIGDGARIESSVNMTGSDQFPLRIGKNVVIKGTSYLFGSIIDDEIFIEHSVIIKKKVDKHVKKDGNVQEIRYYLPMPEGFETIKELKRK